MHGKRGALIGVIFHLGFRAAFMFCVSIFLMKMGGVLASWMVTGNSLLAFCYYFFLFYFISLHP